MAAMQGYRLSPTPSQVNRKAPAWPRRPDYSLTPTSACLLRSELRHTGKTRWGTLQSYWSCSMDKQSTLASNTSMSFLFANKSPTRIKVAEPFPFGFPIFKHSQHWETCTHSHACSNVCLNVESWAKISLVVSGKVVGKMHFPIKQNLNHQLLKQSDLQKHWAPKTASVQPLWRIRPITHKEKCAVSLAFVETYSVSQSWHNQGLQMSGCSWDNMHIRDCTHPCETCMCACTHTERNPLMKLP